MVQYTRQAVRFLHFLNRAVNIEKRLTSALLKNDFASYNKIYLIEINLFKRIKNISFPMERLADDLQKKIKKAKEKLVHIHKTNQQILNDSKQLCDKFFNTRDKDKAYDDKGRQPAGKKFCHVSI